MATVKTIDPLRASFNDLLDWTSANYADREVLLYRPTV